jgi:hypothetical protein
VAGWRFESFHGDQTTKSPRFTPWAFLHLRPEAEITCRGVNTLTSQVILDKYLHHFAPGYPPGYIRAHLIGALFSAIFEGGPPLAPRSRESSLNTSRPGGVDRWPNCPTPRPCSAVSRVCHSNRTLSRASPSIQTGALRGAVHRTALLQRQRQTATTDSANHPRRRWCDTQPGIHCPSATPFSPSAGSTSRFTAFNPRC